VIEQMGYEAHLDVVRIVEEVLPDDVAERAEHGRGARGIVVDRVFRASGEPAVLSRDHVPTHHLAVDAEAVSAERSVFAFVHRWTPHEIRYSVASIFATDADERVAELLAIDPGTAVLGMEHCHIDERDEIIGVTQAYVRTDLIRFAVVRSNPDL
jgi:DNA-binding GntR family transcriptional regulator